MLTVSGSSHDLKKLGPNSSYDNFANSSVLQDLKISLLRFFTDYPIINLFMNLFINFFDNYLNKYIGK